MSSIESELSEFATDVRKGLWSVPKYLPSKYLYDAKGDELFQRIMELDTYYPARAEGRILKERSDELVEGLRPEEGLSLNLIELGAGDASKTCYLLRGLFQQLGERFRYIPNDISPNVLEELGEYLTQDMPELKIEPWAGDYFQLLNGLKGKVQAPRALLFLGGNIGNYEEGDAQALLHAFADALDQGDRLLIGFDLKKDPRKIHRAYDDDEGVTKKFNLNLLERMNRELGAAFDPDRFLHYPIYDPMDGEARSYLLSDRDQEIPIEAIGEKVHFEAWEPIFMERSRKYSLEGVDELAYRSGFKVEARYPDLSEDFVDVLWVKQ